MFLDATETAVASIAPPDHPCTPSRAARMTISPACCRRMRLAGARRQRTMATRPTPRWGLRPAPQCAVQTVGRAECLCTFQEWHAQRRPCPCRPLKLQHPRQQQQSAAGQPPSYSSDEGSDEGGSRGISGRRVKAAQQQRQSSYSGQGARLRRD